MSDMTPREAADIVEAALPWKLWSHSAELTSAARQVLDVARAAAPEGGDLAARSLDLGNATVVEYLEAVAVDIADDAPVRSGRLRTSAEIVAAHRCAPSVAAPPRETEGVRVAAARWRDADDLSRALGIETGDLHWHELIGRVRDLTGATSPAPGTVRDPERAT